MAIAELTVLIFDPGLSMPTMLCVLTGALLGTRVLIGGFGMAMPLFVLGVLIYSFVKS